MRPNSDSKKSLKSSLPVRRRTLELVAGPVAAGAQLVVGLAARRVLERLVGFVDRLDFLLGVAFLADVGMVFARKPTIGRFEFGIGCVRLDAQCCVVILELHQPPSCVSR